MQTKLTDLSKYRPDIKWSNYFHAASSWIMLYDFLKANPDEIYWGFMHVDPYVAALCLELSVKALASYEDKEFIGKRFSHRTSEILNYYSSKIEEFNVITMDSELMNIIKEYEKTVDSRYGAIGGMFDGEEQQKIVQAAFSLHTVMQAKTNLRL